MKIYIGTSGYGYKAWKGKFYPEGTPPAEMLRFYAQRFGTVEINNTFYRMPTENVLTAWAQQVPDDFIFAFKAPRIITHLKQLRNVREETEYLLRTLSMLGKRLGPVLFQFPGSLPVDLPALKDFLVLLPRTISCAFEFRSPSWLTADILEALHTKGCSLCIADLDEAQAKDIISTASWGYLRLRRSDYSDADLSQWARRVRSQKWERAFVFFKHEEEARGPKMAMRFHEFVTNDETVKSR
jgi:uncharacterized protein YecE (DUF72 family)